MNEAQETHGSPEQIFDSWSGDTAALDDAYAGRTRLIMPGGGISVSTVYKDTDRWMPARVVAHFPPDHQGVIFWFHGTGGAAIGGHLVPNNLSFIKEAVSRQLAVVAINCLDRAGGTWNVDTPAAENSDMQRVAEVRGQLIARGKMNLNDPVYMLGISNGGAFASLWTEEA